MKNNITFVVCSKNAIDTIEQCLSSIKDYPVILVDKDSTDGTLDIAKSFKNVKIVKQKGDGLADAHNIGLEKVKTEFVCIFGSDNMLDYDNVFRLKYRMIYNDWIGASYRTVILNPDTYFDKALNIWWIKKFQEGEREVIGTPSIYKTEILKKFGYNKEMQFCDDSDLGKRLKDAGYKQGYSEFFVYDISKNNLKSIYSRFKMYGVSDFQYWQKYSKDWAWQRKLKSLLHPFKTEWLGLDLFYLPFYILIVSIRCFWYYKSLFRSNKYV